MTNKFLFGNRNIYMVWLEDSLSDIHQLQNFVVCWSIPGCGSYVRSIAVSSKSVYPRNPRASEIVTDQSWVPAVVYNCADTPVIILSPT